LAIQRTPQIANFLKKFMKKTTAIKETGQPFIEEQAMKTYIKLLYSQK
jgi:hypothetical protein